MCWIRGVLAGWTGVVLATGLTPVRADPPDFDCRATLATPLTAGAGGSGDQAGLAVAVDADTALVGIPQDDTGLPNAGAVGVLRFDGRHWVYETKLAAPDPAQGARFGAAVALWRDTAVIGAPGTGKVYFLHRTPAGWIESSSHRHSGAFGDAVAIREDVAVVGAPLAAVQSVTCGAAYVYRWNGAQWREEAQLVAADAHASQRFGDAVAVWERTLLIGAAQDDGSGNATGAAYVFEWDGQAWSQQAKLVGWGTECCSFFGEAVALRDDVAICGARRAVGLAPLSGAAYVFRRTGSTWTNWTKLVASDGVSFDDFGCAVAIAGPTAVIGARRNRDGGVRAGAAYVYRRSGAGWAERAKLVPTGGADGDYFGAAVAVCGGTVVVGAFQADPFGFDSGAAYAFQGLADCTGNGRPDACDIALGISADLNGNGVPDECEKPGDLNCDGVADSRDVSAFVLALCHASRYAEEYPDCRRLNADVNGDGLADFGDINPFVGLVSR